jgi:polysaccharide biosynthesis protein PslG
MAERPRYFWIGIAVLLSIATACTVAAVSSSSGGTRIQPLITSMAPAPASSRPGIPIGLAYGNTLFKAAPGALAAGLDDAQALGAGWIRVDLPWDGIQTSSPQSYDWSGFDAIVSAANSRGLHLLVTVVDPPSWARSPACASQETCEPADPAAYAQFAGLAARRYAPLGVHDWEIWNEENLGSFSTAADPEGAYEALLADSYTAIHAADKHAVVMLGGLGMVQTDPGQGWTGAYQFLAGVARDGGLASADAVAVHPYDWNNLPAASPVFAMIDGSGESLESILEAYGRAQIPFWITETGAPTAGSGAASDGDDGTGASHVTYARQAQLATATVATETRDPRIAGLFWYTDTDLPQNDLYYGLRDANGVRKPAFSALQAAIAAYQSSIG